MASGEHSDGRRGYIARLRAEIDLLDQAVVDAVLRTPTPTLDPVIRRLSRASDYKGLWFATSAVVAAVDGRRGRRAAVQCLATVGATSVVADLVAKLVFPRSRPDSASVPRDRTARRPTSSSFPSGHTACAIAFATAFRRQYPILGLPVSALATAVGYSRIHTGVHYPSDVIAGALVGAGVASLTAPLFDLADRRGRPSPRIPLRPPAR
jgi:undecaprenyl-diphosphatase